MSNSTAYNKYIIRNSTNICFYSEMSDNDKCDDAPKKKRMKSEESHNEPTKNITSYRQKRFQPEWLFESSPFKSWLRPVRDDNFKCKCVACNVILVCGKSELEKHSSAKRHIKKLELMESASTEINLKNDSICILSDNLLSVETDSRIDVTDDEAHEIDETAIETHKRWKMSQTHFSLSWDSYQASICSHFSTLQQNGDFVDLTLAADGHLVKVHQLILGIASPYVKELIHSAPCKHPVIFLNNVSYATLCSILQYVYTGEVAITEDELAPFFEAAKALQIQGIDTTDVNAEIMKEKFDEPQAKLDTRTGLQTVHVHVSDDKASHFESVSVPLAAKNIKLTGTIEPVDESVQLDANTSTRLTSINSKRPFDTEGSSRQSEEMEMDVLDEDEVPAETSGDVNPMEYFELTRMTEVSPSAYPNTKEVQYTVSNRGSLQLILNRYVYNLFSKSNGGVVRRWRCVDYRDQKCLACTVTNGNVVIKRTNLHNHPYHDKKILGKIKKKAVYSAIKLASGEVNLKS